jgi:hypothetical protein
MIKCSHEVPTVQQVRVTKEFTASKMLKEKILTLDTQGIRRRNIFHVTSVRKVSFDILERVIIAVVISLCRCH